MSISRFFVNDKCLPSPPPPRGSVVYTDIEGFTQTSCVRVCALLVFERKEGEPREEDDTSRRQDHARRREEGEEDALDLTSIVTEERRLVRVRR